MSAPSAPHDALVKKRRRPALACEQCRRRKVRCDRTSPCNHCSKSGTPEQCTYVPVHVPKQKRAPLPGTANAGPVSILPAPAPTPPDSQCSTGNPQLVPTSASTLVTVSETGDSDVRRWTENVYALEQKLEGVALANEQPTSSTGESIIGNGDNAPPADVSVPKTRYYGRSHWMNGLSLLPVGFENLVNPKATQGNLFALLSQCKIFGRHIKESRLQSTLYTTTVTSLDISRSTADRLLELYISSFEHVFPILHIPSFKSDYDRYWSDPRRVTTVFRVQLQLVLALGSCLLDETFTLRNQAAQWVNEAQLWLLTPPEKSRMTIAGIQIMLLLTLARSVCGAEQDTVWVLTGLLLRTAMCMGLHRDPSKLGEGGMSIFRVEMRRRLWLTILELNLQSAYDAGGAPLISAEDYDTLPPANLDDEELVNESEDRSLESHIDGGSTRLSAALALAHSLPLRLSILRHANDFRAQDSYKETLRLNSELVSACHQLSQTLEGLSKTQSTTAATQFHASLAELLAYRCFHTLHQPVIVRSLSDPKYYFSQKMYIDGALKIAHISGLTGAQTTDENNAPRVASTSALNGKDGPHSGQFPSAINLIDDTQGSGGSQKDPPEALFNRLLTNGAGMFRNVPIQATLGIILEFVSKWGDNSAPSDASPGLGCLPGIHNTREADFAALASFLNAARGWTLRRIRSGEVSIKGHYFLTCYLCHVSAIENGVEKTDLEESVVAGAVEAAEVCLRELRSMAEAQGLSLEMPQEENAGDSSWHENPALPYSGLNVSDFGNADINVMDMDWMGEWPLDGMTEFTNFSWGINMNMAP